MDEATALKKFRAWYVEPIEMMKPNVNGGFIAFMVALALFERMIAAKLKLEGKPINDKAMQQRMADELGITYEEQHIFWDVFRNGLFHQGMPKAKNKTKTGYVFHSDFSEKPDLRCYKGKQVLRIDPWKFTEWVIKQFLLEPRLIFASEIFPLATVDTIDFDQFTDLPCANEPIP